jgi:cytoskeletal protein CcmA (bactofilin family)
MWWSKQSQAAAPSFSPAFSSTLTIDSPIEAPASQGGNTTSHSPNTSRPDRASKRDVAPKNDLRLDDIVEGPISLTCRRLTVGEAARANGDVTAREVIVYGELTGHLLAADRIEIKKHGSVMGDLTTRRILIEEGAYFKGTVQIERRKKPRIAS